MLTNRPYRPSEKGNVLFLILIAVALFAALSYVVTQSTRSGGGSTEREKNILSSAQMTQYPTALRTAIIRMVLGGVGVENINFNTPETFAAVSNANWLVFHPQGGGATFQDAPPDLSVSGASNLPWTFNAEMRVPGIGIDSAGGTDLIAFLPGVSDGVCRQVNEELGITIDVVADECGTGVTIPQVSGVTAAVDAYMNNSHSRASLTTAGIALTPGPGCPTKFNRQASGCFRDVDGNRNVFYSVLLER